MKGIYRFEFEFHDNGVLSGIFVADDSQIKELIEDERWVSFYDKLGKHSEVSFDHTEFNDYVTLVTDDPAAVEMFERYDMRCGYNPLNYVK